MTITYVIEKGSPLTIEEFDDNFHDLDDRVAALEDDPPTPVSIVDVTIDTTTFSLEMSDASTLGPFDVPVAAYAPPEPFEITGTTLTLGTTHANNYLYFTHASACAITIPTYLSVALAVGTEVHFVVDDGGGGFTIAGAVGVTLRKRNDRNLESNGELSVVTAKHIEQNIWHVFGDLEPV